ncbi:hypothetical protein GUJ93_ZPchr0001g32438 [Zizania palustris]|uniref:DUF4220 domain-containing protein n=1 Tax=Zizania palustris TaxID=103762 RepID=A0A8J5RTZ2_ZIZPA|nr:hypothetical protein GUJ93_ZPchr0001g32438 [Zizania palustris]
MEYFNSSTKYCDLQKHDAAIMIYVYNLTNSYTDTANEVSIVATSVGVLLIAALLLTLDLLVGAATLRPAARFVLTSAFSLFLPVTSYLFSEAKKSPGGNDGVNHELPLRARLILIWMLLIELLRRKAEGAVAGIKGRAAGNPANRVGRALFLGYLVFFNVPDAGRKAVFAVLWVVVAAKLVHRLVIAKFVKDSFAIGKNPPLLAAYMAQTLEQEQEQEPHPRRERDQAELMRSCKYAVMGEHKLEKEPGPEGYHVDLHKTVNGEDTVVTVGRVWSLAGSDQMLRSNPKLKRLCLSFALFKLLRREVEETPLTTAETSDCRELIFRGLCNDGAADGRPVTAASTLFQVIHDEVSFVTEYYHSVIPVVLASPFFLLINYFLFPVLVLGLCFMTVVLCGNGDIVFILDRIKKDNFAINVGVPTLTMCILSRIRTAQVAFFSIVDLSITFLLFVTFLYEEAWELVIFVLSNWLTVSMVCDYAVKPPSPLRRNGIRSIQWVRNRMSHRNLRFKQFSVLWFCRLPLMLPTVAVPKEVEQSIMENLAAYDGVSLQLSADRSTMARYRYPTTTSHSKSESVAEVILKWHIATSLLEARFPPPPQKEAASASSSKVATLLSRYCSYLVAFRPEMLPDDVDCAESVYDTMTTELKRELGLKGYYFSTAATRCDKMMAIADSVDEAAPAVTVLRKGVRLAKSLMGDLETSGDEAAVWKRVADVWTEIIVYIAPAKDGEQVRAHVMALARGVEFATVLWALVTHAGIVRPRRRVLAG